MAKINLENMLKIPFKESVKAKYLYCLLSFMS